MRWRLIRENAPATAASVPGTLLRARAAVSVLFFVNGVLYANLVPRLPDLKDSLDLSNAALGSGIAGMPLGALVGGLLVPPVITRLGSATVASVGLVVPALALAALSLAGGWAAFFVLMLAFGASDAAADAGQNAHGFRVQRRYGRSLVNGFHGLWSVGAVVGGLLGSAAAGLQVPLTLHLGSCAVVFSVLALTTRRFLLPGPEDAERVQPDPASSARRGLRGVAGRTVLLLAAAGALSASAAFVEDAAASWSALFMRDVVGSGAATAGLAFVIMQVAMTVGRLTGDRVVDRLGQRLVGRLGGAAVTVGAGLALAVPTTTTTLAGFALAGLGVATLVPAALHAADELPGLPAGLGITVVSSALRLGFLASPVLVGAVADASNLRAALLTVPVAGLIALVATGLLVPRSSRARATG